MGLLFDTPKKSPKPKKRNAIQILMDVYAEARAYQRGKARARAKAAAWYARWQEAKRNGVEFNEPPPFLDDNGDSDKE